MKYLLDTCVLSEYVKKKPNYQVINWLDSQDESNLFISILSRAELKKGIIRIKTSQPERYRKLWNWLQKIDQRFAERIPLFPNFPKFLGVMCVSNLPEKGTEIYQ